MKDRIIPAMVSASSLQEVHLSLLEVFGAVKTHPEGRIGYVSGVITSDGPAQIEANLAKLARYTDRLRTMHNFPIFSATDIFTDDLYDRIKAASILTKDWLLFWRGVLSSGHVTDIFMTPGWERSHGAMDEHTVARELGLKIHLVSTLF